MRGWLTPLAPDGANRPEGTPARKAKFGSGLGMFRGKPAPPVKLTLGGSLLNKKDN